MRRWSVETEKKEQALRDKGYFESIENCPECGHHLMLHASKRYAQWQSDVRIYTYEYKCCVCGYERVDHDSD